MKYVTTDDASMQRNKKNHFVKLKNTFLLLYPKILKNQMRMCFTLEKKISTKNKIN